MASSLKHRVESHLLRLLERQISRRKGGNERLFILIYHRILDIPDPMRSSDPDIASFRWQMEALVRNFNVLPLSQALNQLQSGNLPPRSISITFDDGYKSTHDLAMPILKEFNLSATVFIATDYLDGSNMWNDRIIEAIRHIRPGTVDLTSCGFDVYTIKNQTDRAMIADQLVNAVKYRSSEQRFALTRQLEQLAGAMSHEELMLSKVMIKNLSDNGFEIGGHTVTHPILLKIKDEEGLNEMIQCKQTLESITGKPVDLFAYPNGKAGLDYDQRHIELAKTAGYRAAFCTSLDTVSTNTDLFQIPRGCPWDKTPLMFQIRLLRWLAQ
ncbi:polysaccharide deacetylase family protein [Undibacterium sp. SXout20W]|uniref:polysaccharide deacetylase family protein n=1 Tax=Undibacterium sp. SXout20W TaxID=3413051 RepID=UPI003BF2EA12